MLPAQGLCAVVALAVLALWPPASGAMMLVPLAGGDAGAMARAGLAAGAVLLGPGPLPGSMIVVGNRSRIARQFAFDEALVIAAPPAGCGPAARRT